MFFYEPGFVGFLSLANRSLRSSAHRKQTRNKRPQGLNYFLIFLMFLADGLLGRFLRGEFEW